jgi:hypothetical protein
LEQLLRMCLLEVKAANLFGWDVRGNGEDRYVRTMRIVEPVDEMQVAGSTAGGTNCEFTRDGSLARGGKGGGLLVTYVLPRNCAVMKERVRESVE